jgi:hypothetical protein
MAEWYVKVGVNVGLALTRLAPLMGSLILVSLFYGEYYAIPGVLASIGVVFAVGWVLKRPVRAPRTPLGHRSSPRRRSSGSPLR